MFTLLFVRVHCSCTCSKPRRVSTPIFKDFLVLVRNFQILLEGVISLAVVTFSLQVIGNGAATSETPFVQ